MAFTDLLQIYNQACQTLDRQVAQFQTKFQSQLQCKRGCSSCCQNALFRIRLVEGQALLSAYQQASVDTRQAIRDNVVSPLAGRQSDCPVLVDGACSLYKHRPALCRAYGTMVQLKDKVSTCRLNFNNIPEGLALDVIDIEPMYTLLDELSLRIWQESPLSESSPPPVFTIRDIFSKHFGV